MTTPEPPHDSNMEEHEKGNDSTSTEEKKQYKKLKVASHTETSNILIDTPGSHPSTSTSPPSSLPSSPSSNNTSNNTNRQQQQQDKDSTTSTITSSEEDNLFHKKSSKQGKGNNNNNSNNNKNNNNGSSWGTRLRTHPKSVERFGAKKKKSKDENNSFNNNSNNDLNKQVDGAGEVEEDESDLPHDEADVASNPPSSPHPNDDVPLETLFKHGSGWVCVLNYILFHYIFYFCSYQTLSYVVWLYIVFCSAALNLFNSYLFFLILLAFF